METDFRKGERVIGFHGAGGGGSMMNMDALFARGFKIADFVDTSGNPPASKVYRAARIILSQPGIDGYYAGGSGVASQEQFNTARGLVKAFMDDQLNVPAVIRVGGNARRSRPSPFWSAPTERSPLRSKPTGATIRRISASSGWKRWSKPISPPMIFRCSRAVRARRAVHLRDGHRRHDHLRSCASAATARAKSASTPASRKSSRLKMACPCSISAATKPNAAAVSSVWPAKSSAISSAIAAGASSCRLQGWTNTGSSMAS